jgi:hypothetical protein
MESIEELYDQAIDRMTPKQRLDRVHAMLN